LKILVTGGAGMLGRDVALAARAVNHEPIALAREELDITDREAVERAVIENNPGAVVNCAAWTDVDGAEEREADAARVNGDGSGNVAAAAAEAGAAVVVPSTDYVFDGRAGRAYAEDDEPSPLGAYGRTKLAGERAALAANPEGTRIARTAWLYGSAGRNFVDTMRRVGAERDEVTVVDDQEGCPTWTRDLAAALEALLEQPPGVYHTAGGGSVTWAGFARAIFEEAGIACRVVPITTEQLGRPAPRPAHAPLAVTRPSAPRLRHWRDALHDYILETA
jgi:dTDP-4-dehydrorhamnose reductase